MADAPRIDTARFATEPARIPVRYFVLAGLCLAAAIAYIHRGMLAVPAKSIVEQLGISDDQMGWVLSAFFWTYALGQVPCGWLGDRYGSRRMLPVFALLWSAAAAGLGVSSRFEELLACQLLCGLGQAGLFPCAVQTIALWFPRSQRALSSGLLASFMSIGAAVASVLIGEMLNYWRWPEVFVALASLGVVWAGVFFVWFRDRPEEHLAVSAAELATIRGGAAAAEPAENIHRGGEQRGTPWGAILASPAMWLIAGQQFFRAAGYVFYGTWFPTYLQQTRGVSIEQSGYLTGLALGGVVVGSLAGGWISDAIFRRTGSVAASRKGLAIAGLGACAAFVLLAYFIHDPLLASAVIACGSFCSGAAGPAGYTITMDLGGRNVSTVFSLMNMAGNFGAALSPKFVNWLVNARGGDWDPVLVMYSAIYLASTICWAFINPRRPIVAERIESKPEDRE